MLRPESPSTRRGALLRLVASLAVVLGLGLGITAAAPDKPVVRQPLVAGAFYPADPKELQTMVDELLARAAPPAINDPIVALIAPHAGYPYSGGVAAHSYALLKGRKFERVVVIAPSHFDGFPFVSVYDGEAYATPLGTIPVDKAFAAKLAGSSPLIRLSSRGHSSMGSQAEHALEVELPFLQRALGQFNLVPVIMGEQSYEASRALGVQLAKLIQGPGTLIVASSDLSHYHPYDEATSLDRKTLTAVEEWDYLSLLQNLEQRTWEACGGGPIAAAMIAAERLGANRARLLKYANSGDTTGDRSRVVGYGALALVREPPSRGGPGEPVSLSGHDKDELLILARKSAETAVREGKLYQPPVPSSPALLQDRGAFVTIRRKGELRGCIGYTAPVKPLYLGVRDVAAFAAVRDPRFAPVGTRELGDLDYEVSVLSPFRHLRDVNQIQIGRHGLLIKKGKYEGILLPQVPVEERWDRKTFLREIGLKAGLPPTAWQDEEADLFTFSALVFAEHQLSALPAGDETAFPRQKGLPGERQPGPPSR
ncbi:MAG TPA: AmmeMemoRadiSam system protein B [Terriglobales bacterium]|nr:AmmeMemoRadiSam system protein B [Terriglobales bacterium]